MSAAGYEKRRKRHPLWATWIGMRQRCTNPLATGFARWGGRGIKVCERWENFAAFVEDMGPRPEGCTLDRINNDGNYEPSNCAWRTRKEQAANRTNHRGSAHYLAKLTEDEVELLRAMAAGSSIPRTELARIFHITRPHAYGLISRKSWRHVP